MPRQALPSRRATRAVALLALAALAVPCPARAVPRATPDPDDAAAYLVDPAHLIDGHFHEAFPGAGQADWGLTMDTAFALAATGRRLPALRGLVTFLERGTDPAGTDVASWTGLGTPWASGAALGKQALLAEVVGADPRDVGGHDLLAALAGNICDAPSTAPDDSCASAGNYRWATSVFGQALGVLAQVRGGDEARARAPITYLAGLQHADGSFPGLIPPGPGGDVDSTAMAAMALDLAGGPGPGPDRGPDRDVERAVERAVAWIASQQRPDGGFEGAAGESTNSAGLAVQGLSLRPGYDAEIAAARSFLAGQQNADGGFSIGPDTPGSDVRASAQSLSGMTGVSFGALSVDLGGVPEPVPASTPTTTRPDPTTTRNGPRTTTRRPPRTASAHSSRPTRTAGGGRLVDAAPGDAAASTLATPPASPSGPSGPAATSTPTTAPAPAPMATAPTAAATAITPAAVVRPVARAHPLWWVVLGVALGFGAALALLALSCRPRLAGGAR